jgi:hypothetical protein
MGAIVRVDKRHYRKIAQENWGLTDEQMVGMHVHHRTPRSQGGTNDASNLYVCSAYYHAHVWHNGDQFTLWASVGGKSSNPTKTKKLVETGKRVGSLPNSELQKKTVKEVGLKRKESGELSVWWETSHKKMSKPVLLTFIETGDTFEFKSLADAARGLNLDRARVRKCCQGKMKQTKGFTASYIK